MSVIVLVAAFGTHSARQKRHQPLRLLLRRLSLEPSTNNV
jgi:hypothetical protein